MNMKTCGSRKPFCSFVNHSVQCILQYYKINDSPLTCFAEGSVCRTRNYCPDYAVLEQGNARLFCTVMQENASLFGISKATVILRETIDPRTNTLHTIISHSCYPRNLRRWIAGTVARKNRNRAEFCALLYCWGIGWNKQSESVILLQAQLMNVFRQYYSFPADETFSVDMIWNTCEAAYRDSF